MNRLKNYLKKENIDCAVILSKDPSFLYFLKENIEQGILVIFRKNNPILFISRLEEASKNLRIKKIIYKKPLEQIKELLDKHKVKTIGISESYIFLKQYRIFKKIVKKTRNIEDFLAELRQKKTEEEINKIKKACKITDNIFLKLIKNFNFKTEEQVRRFILKEMAEEGVEKSFDVIVASEINAAVPHHSRLTKLKKGFLVLDFGVKYQGYCSDMTRTIYLGIPSKQEIRLYNKLLAIQKQAIKKIKRGVKAKDINSFVRNSLEEYEKYFTHSLGHGIGIKIHERPNLSEDSKDILSDNMVFTVEPGIYIPNKLGIRIEDDIILNKKPIILTKSRKDLITIKNFK